MSTGSSKKRGGGDKSNAIPPKKMVPEVLEAPADANYDVTIIVDGQRFQCLKEELSQHSKYLEAMFNSDLQEKNKKEVELGGIESATFGMFLKVIHGEQIVTDVTVEKMLSLADYLISASLEQTCMRHLANETAFSLKKQFLLAETHHSEKLMRQVCGSIKDAHELDEVVPKDLDSFCNTTKNTVMQRSFELLGIRQPPSPPLPEDPDQFFENRMNQIIDQIDIQNHHGDILLDQVELLIEHLFIEKYLPKISEIAVPTIRDNNLIKELTDELREAHDHEEANFIQAQILVIKNKDIYTMVQDPQLLHPASRTSITTAIRKKLKYLALLINRNKRSPRSTRVNQGNREIDEIYRDITKETIEFYQTQHLRDVKDNVSWLEVLDKINNNLATRRRNKQGRARRPMPDGIRQVPNQANFRIINEIVSNLRYIHYLVPRLVQPGGHAAVNGNNQNRNMNDQNREEPDQEEN